MLLRRNISIRRVSSVWVHNRPYESIALKAVRTVLALLPQKPNESSKSKEHLEELTTRITLWTEGRMDELINEGL